MKYIDFRSDTVTLPTPNMYEAMNNAILGDDVYDDDPTVKELEEYAANMLGKESALFVPSGTFSNQLAIFTHTTRGDEIIVGEDTHIIIHEVGAVAVIAGVNMRTVPFKNKEMDIESIKKCIRGEDIHYPKTSLICIENAHSFGYTISKENMKNIKELANEQGIATHMDGARFFNAAESLDIDYKEMASYADSLSICLSKGLCAPIGSLLVGAKEFIKKAKKNRKLMGGGLRQVGIIAAAGLVGLKEMTKRIHEDRENAKYLATKLEEINGVSVDKEKLDINMVFVKIPELTCTSEELKEKLFKNGYKINTKDGEYYRLVTNNDIKRNEIDSFVNVLKKSM